MTGAPRQPRARRARPAARVEVEHDRLDLGLVVVGAAHDDDLVPDAHRVEAGEAAGWSDRALPAAASDQGLIVAGGHVAVLASRHH
jgi:hypothetical protein